MTRTAIFRRQTLARALLVGVVGSLSLSAQAGEPAQPTQVTKHVTVRYSDLEIAGTEGARALYARLRAAAQEACGPTPLVREHREWADFRACHDRALNEAVREIDNKQLYALHAARKGRSAVS